MKLMNLFQIFDQSSSIGPCFSFMFIVVLILLTFIKESKFSLFMKSIFLSPIGESMKVSKSIKFLCLFLLITSLNLLSLIPSSFSNTSHISLNLPMGMTLWLGINMMFAIKETKKYLSHLVPSGSPSILIPLMIMIELISNMIRPITLSIRLTANIIAGHLLVSLLESSTSSPIPMFLLYSLEIMVAIIQGYIFSLLTMLYLSEAN